MIHVRVSVYVFYFLSGDSGFNCGRALPDSPYHFFSDCKGWSRKPGQVLDSAQPMTAMLVRKSLGMRMFTGERDVGPV